MCFHIRCARHFRVIEANTCPRQLLQSTSTLRYPTDVDQQLPLFSVMSARQICGTHSFNISVLRYLRHSHIQPSYTNSRSQMAIAEVLQSGPVGQPDITYTPDYEKYLARVQNRLATERLEKSLPSGFPQKLESDLVWDCSDIAARFDWTYELTTSDLEEIKKALQHFKSLGKPLGFVNKDTFPLSQLHGRLREMSKQIHDGFGFKVVRGIPVDEHSREDILIIYAGVASHIASMRGRQDHQWEGKPADVVLNHIKDLSATFDAGKIGAPAYTTDKQVFHTDSGDVIALLCLETAADGGQSKLSSSWRVYNELAETRPDLIRTLAESWPTEM